MKFIKGGGKVWKKSCWQWFKLLFHFFLFWWSMKNEEVMCQNLNFYHFFKYFKKMHVFGLPPSFFRYYQIKKKWNSNLNHFQQLFFSFFLWTWPVHQVLWHIWLFDYLFLVNFIFFFRFRIDATYFVRQRAGYQWEQVLIFLYFPLFLDMQ